MKKDDIWKYIVYTIGIFIISGISFKIGEIVTSAKEITCKEALESFYYSSWTIYTTIFGIIGVALGIVFPLYQSNKQEKEYKTEIEKIKTEFKNKISENNAEMTSFKSKYEDILESLRQEATVEQEEREKFKKKMDKQFIELITYNYEDRIKKTKGIDGKTVQDELTAKGMNQDVIDGVIKNLIFLGLI